MSNKYARFLLGLRGFLKGRVDPEEALELAKASLLSRVRDREGNFLNLAAKGIFGNPNSPYLKLLGYHKIAHSDLKRWVSQDGIEMALDRLFQEGVYFTIEEFKGLATVARNGARFRLSQRQFDNPFLSSAYEVRSGATRSTGTRINIDFDYLVQRSHYDAFILSLHNVLTCPVANWFPVFPGAPGINSSLRFARIGNPPKKWFTQVDHRHLKVDWKRRWGTNYLIYMSRALGVPLAKPEFVDLNNAYEIAKWASQTLDAHPNCVIYTFASSAVRVCLAARTHGLNIAGTKFLVTGEPLTPQKKREIDSLGASAVPIYGISEAGVVAAGCDREFGESDHCHSLKDTIAIRSYKRSVPECDGEVDSLLFSSLLYESPKILLNVEMGDHGAIDQRPCSCEFGKLGFDWHLSDIRSFEKLTGEGVSFVNSDLARIVEEILPKSFGGGNSDYQLVESEGSDGLTFLNLLISPIVHGIDENAAAAAFINALKSAETGPENWAQSGSEMWRQVGTIRVVRDLPIPTRRGKVLPFHSLKRSVQGDRELAYRA